MRALSSIFGAIGQVGELPIHSIFNADDLPGYQTCSLKECPECAKQHKKSTQKHPTAMVIPVFDFLQRMFLKRRFSRRFAFENYLSKKMKKACNRLYAVL